MQLRCGDMFNNHVIANCPQTVPVKEFGKLDNIWWRYGQRQSGTFFETRCRQFGSGGNGVIVVDRLVCLHCWMLRDCMILHIIRWLSISGRSAW